MIMIPSLRTLMLAALLGGFFLSACVSQKKYNELEMANEDLAKKSAWVDSLEKRTAELSTDVRDIEGYYGTTLQEIEQLKSANKSLYSSYDDLRERYDALISQRKDVLSTSSYEKQSLMEQISIQQEQLEKKERYLQQLEWDLVQKEERLNQMQNQDFESDLERQQQIIQELQAQLRQKENNLQQIKQKINQSMYGISQSDFSVTEKRGKLYISMSQNLLFKSGSSTLDVKGKQALKQLAGALTNNPGIEIMVEGHTDTDGSADKNWDLSVMRATAVVRELANNGVDPYRLTAAGRSFFDPIATNATTDGKAQNRRTEIIVSPRLDELMELVNQ